MSVTDGQLGNAANFNSAFGSKTIDNTYVGKQTLNRPGSGAQIDDAQLEINKNKMNSPNEQILGGGSPIVIDANSTRQHIKVKSSGGNVTLQNKLFGSGVFQDGTQVRILGTDDADTVTINQADESKGVILNGSSVQMIKYRMLVLEYDLLLDRWIEVSRNL